MLPSLLEFLHIYFFCELKLHFPAIYFPFLTPQPLPVMISVYTMSPSYNLIVCCPGIEYTFQLVTSKSKVK